MANNSQLAEKARFEMVKKHHAQLLEKAIREGKIDPLMIGIAQKASQSRNYFTTSTCSGRITLMELDKKEGKQENVFYRKWHSLVKQHEVWKAITEYAGKNHIWLRQDSFVYVIGARDTKHAQHVFRACQKAGVKRYGIHHIEDGKVLLEVFGTQNMAVPVVRNGKPVVDEKYVDACVEIANTKWKKNEAKRKELEKELEKVFLEK